LIADRFLKAPGYKKWQAVSALQGAR